MNRDHPQYRANSEGPQFWAACKRTQIDRTFKAWGAREWHLAYELAFASDVTDSVLRMVVRWDDYDDAGLAPWGYAHYVDGALYAPDRTHPASSAADAVRAVLRARAQNRVATAVSALHAAQDELARLDAADGPADEG